MTDHEKEILDKIKHSTEEVQIPESLDPDQILKMLEEHDSGTNKGHHIGSFFIHIDAILKIRKEKNIHIV